MSLLHPKRALTALVPLYVSRFGCIGPDCEDNCCTGWRVNLDKKTFNAYRQAKLPALADRLEHQVKRQRSQASDANYARIELNAVSRECPFLEQRLCAVQRDLGEDYLSNTCATYPRASRDFNGQFEQSLTLSCPEAARQALLQPDAFDFVEAPLQVRVGTFDVIKPKLGLSLSAMNEIRVFCLQLLRTDGLELWQKLAVLGVFCERLTATLQQGGHAGIPALLQDFVVMVEEGLVLDALRELQPNHEIQARVFALFWQGKVGGRLSSGQQAVQHAVARGLGADPETGQVTEQELVARYHSGLGRLAEALQAAPQLLEHYLLNEIFRDLFPFQGITPYDDYLKLISRFGLLRLMLAARCNADSELPSPLELSQTVQVFCRRFQHDPNWAAQVNSALRNSGWDGLEKVYGFLRT
ncbi:hypothetical protein C6P61_11285 [Malikia spinosa]|uniref:Lysine-N-methylase n=1 Tax=Malikia spinosa TaxID=86180 RepID=A0A2S9KDE0_9BURK|nr:flagellin lysine-N-methylase [Malikia spinosa]PRD68463.1 hypothetical protein C6P61_11285 [Malikia spinosa]